ncbi:MAG: hypothetical protein QOJ98_3583, partial [Acidobacteriota bacterium]|nr:hypothetical protein [Acidobacteriota bacterium]
MPPILLSRIERSVLPVIRERGEQYARRGAVVVKRRSSPHEPVGALVRGSDAYQVRVQYEEHDLLAECTCRYFADRFDVCKHIWATIVVCAEQKLEFPGYVDSVLPDESASYDDDDEDDEDDEGEPDRGNVVPLRRAWDEPSRWRAQVRSVAQPGVLLLDTARPVPEITWVLDPRTSGTAVAVEITTRSRKKNGELANPKPLRIPFSAVAGLTSSLDREILATISSSHYMYGSLDSRLSIYWPMAEYVVPKLVATGRLLIRNGDQYELCAAFDAGEPWRLSVRAEEQEGRYLLAAALKRGEERLPLDAALAITRGGFVIFRDSIARFADEGLNAWATLLRREKVEIPAREVDEFIRSIPPSGAPRIEWPAAVAWQERRVVPRPKLEIFEQRGSNLHGAPLFDYDGEAMEAFGTWLCSYREKTRTIV